MVERDFVYGVLGNDCHLCHLVTMWAGKPFPKGTQGFRETCQSAMPSSSVSPMVNVTLSEILPARMDTSFWRMTTFVWGLIYIFFIFLRVFKW